MTVPIGTDTFICQDCEISWRQDDWCWLCGAKGESLWAAVPGRTRGQYFMTSTATWSAETSTETDILQPEDR